MNTNELHRNLEKIQVQLRERTKSPVRIIGVTKTHPASLIMECVNAGLLHVAENRAQEVRDKMETVQKAKAKLHFIGSIQRKNLKYLKNGLHSFDSLWELETAEKLASYYQNEPIDVLLQINATNENGKNGLPCDATTVQKFIEQIKSLQGIKVSGLMAMGPTPGKMTQKEWEILTYRTFAKVKSLHDQVSEYTGLKLPRLSMGMSSDFLIAAQEGATEIRLGTILFGNREHK